MRQFSHSFFLSLSLCLTCPGKQSQYLYCSVFVAMIFSARWPVVTSGTCVLFPTRAKANTKERRALQNEIEMESDGERFHSQVNTKWEWESIDIEPLSPRLLLAVFVIISIFFLLTIDLYSVFLENKRKVVACSTPLHAFFSFFFVHYGVRESSSLLWGPRLSLLLSSNMWLFGIHCTLCTIGGFSQSLTDSKGQRYSM